jgi:hypothetical protein
MSLLVDLCLSFKLYWNIVFRKFMPFYFIIDGCLCNHYICSFLRKFVFAPRCRGVSARRRAISSSNSDIIGVPRKLWYEQDLLQRLEQYVTLIMTSQFSADPSCTNQSQVHDFHDVIDSWLIINASYCRYLCSNKPLIGRKLWERKWRHKCDIKSSYCS